MEIEQGTSIEAIGEQEVDFSMAQLVETSDAFLRWFVSQTDPDIEVAAYIGGVIHASYAGEGESDIEFGVRTETGDRHLVLVENKIDAVKQPNQIKRYYNRGEYRIGHDDWDSYTVCLLAPERYVTETDETGFDAIVHYETVRDQLGQLSHDGAEFIQSVFEAALKRSQRSATADATDTLRAIEDRFLAETGIEYLERDPQYTDYNKRTSFRSTHPDHHDAIRYDVFVGETGDAGRTTVRLQIKSIDGLSDEERDSLKLIASDHQDLLPEYKWRLDRKVNIADKKVGHDAVTQDESTDSYVDAIVDELRELSDAFHPVFVEESI